MNLRPLNKDATGYALPGLALLALGIASFTMREHVLDDTLIHTTIGRNFFLNGEFAFNPSGPFSGSSAPVYTWLVAQMGYLLAPDRWPWALKGVGLLLQAGCLGLVLLLCRRLFAGARAGAYAFAVAALLIVFPGTTRWYQDGMETALVIFLVLAGPVTYRLSRENPQPPWAAWLTGALLALPVLVRIDAAPIVLTYGCWLLIDRERRIAIWLGYGATFLMGLLLPVMLYGALLPPSGSAKQAGSWVWGFLPAFIRVVAIATPFLLLGPLVTLGLCLKGRLMEWVKGIVAWFPLAFILAYGIYKGQSVQGARYFMPALMAGWLLTLILYSRGIRDLFQHSALVRKAGVGALTLVCLANAALVVPVTQRINRIQYAWPDRLLEPGKRIASWDIGYLGWYTPNLIIDFSGLIHGEAIARADRQNEPRSALLIQRFGWPDYVVAIPGRGQRLDEGALLIHGPEGQVRPYQLIDTVYLKGTGQLHSEVFADPENLPPG
ncbi:MAG: hypothetical protein ACFE0O_06710 [Opitutales bacterium]